MARFGQDEESSTSLDLSTVVETYTRKAADLRRKCDSLARELAAIQGELELVEARRVVLAEVLDDSSNPVDDSKRDFLDTASFTTITAKARRSVAGDQDPCGKQMRCG
ncbi:hypothetical protein ACIRL2_38770 [Embleya sp. NPDC127516]|uniref:hypothetical protein n=1 Tax=Embleya sp. NPDC127516 TaxID=3363990 RepID=UPI003825C9F4